MLSRVSTCDASGTANSRVMKRSAALSVSLIVMVLANALAGSAGRGGQEPTPLPSVASAASVETLQQQRRDAEAAEKHSEVARIDLLILASIFRQMGDFERDKHDMSTAELLNRESANAGNLSDSPPSELVKEFALRTKNKTLDHREQALIVQLGDTYNSLGTAFVHMNQLSSALDAYRAATAWWPQTQGLNRNLGLIDAQTDHAEQAVQYLTPIVYINPDDADARMALAMSLSALNRQKAVLNTLKPIADELTKKPAVAYIYAQALLATGDKSGALILLSDLASTPMAPGIAFLVGRTLVVLGDDANALIALHTAEGSDRIPRLYYFEAMVQLRLKQPSEAISLLQKQLQMTPKDTEAEYALAFTQLSEGDAAEATKHLENVLSRAPNHPDANYEYGKLLLGRGDMTQAISHLETAEKIAPNKPFIHYQLQLAYRKAGRIDDAKRELRIYNAEKSISEGHRADPVGMDHP